MNAFDLPSATPIAFGPGRLAAIGEEVSRLAGGATAVLIAADPFVAQSGTAERVKAALQAAGHEARVFSDIASDPKEAQIDACAVAAREMGAAVVVAIGGGSAMDVGKLAAASAGGSAPTRDYALMANPLPANPLKTVCVPTTSGTGAEVTRTVVFSLADGSKVWAWGDQMQPALALLDPELTVSLPAPLTAATGVDALVHAIEAMTNRRSHPLGDANALQAIRLVSLYLRRAVKDGGDLEARGHLQIAAALAGLAIDVNGTAVAHAIGHALGTVGRVHHGRAVGLSLRVALPGNAKAGPKRHALVAEAFGLGRNGRSDEALAHALPVAYDGFLREVGLEVSLKDNGLGPADTDRLTQETLEPENQPMLKVNVRELSPKDVRDLCHAVLAAQ